MMVSVSQKIIYCIACDIIYAYLCIVNDIIAYDNYTIYE